MLYEMLYMVWNMGCFVWYWVLYGVWGAVYRNTVIQSLALFQSSLHSVGVASVINLQSPWEHSKCGPRLDTSGFTYAPEHLMREGGISSLHSYISGLEYVLLTFSAYFAVNRCAPLQYQTSCTPISLVLGSGFKSDNFHSLP